MRDIIDRIERWQHDGETFALATVVATSSSAPRGPGAAVAVHPDGTVLGSVSGGCVEGAVVATCLEVLDGADPRLVTYGYSDDEAFAVGLTCGGTIHVFVEAVAPQDDLDLPAIAAAIGADEPVAVATLVEGPGAVGSSLTVWPDRVEGSLGTEGLDVAVTDDARGLLAIGRSARRHYGPDGQRRVDDVGVFVEVFAPRPRMLVFGAIDFASSVTSIGRFLGYRVTVCDARGVFATAARFPDADEIVVEWPHRYLQDTAVDQRTVICVLTHDPKFDVPVLVEALRTDAGFIGVMGSRRTHDDRLERLREEGVSEEQLARLRSPIGLDLGGRTPEETAVSIAAEIVQRRWGGSGAPLAATEGRIHHEPTPLGEPSTAADDRPDASPEHQPTANRH
jgi:xanthine dehydrogenase accessory factor